MSCVNNARFVVTASIHAVVVFAPGSPASLGSGSHTNDVGNMFKVAT